MENISITDIIAIIGVIVMLWKTFFSKSDKQKLLGENDKTRAETDNLEVDTMAKYEALIDRLVERNKKQDEEIQKLNKRFDDLEKKNKKLEREIRKRDLIIDCMDIQYRELAQKAIDAGVKDVSMDTNCFSLADEEI